MRHARGKTFLATALIIIGAVIALVVIIRGLIYFPQSEVISSVAYAAPQATTSENAGLPVRLDIPKIGVHAAVQDVGITYKGNMGVPNNYTDVGWYKYGTLPGNVGSAVIDGHVDNGFSLPGVFSNLKQLSIGDDIYIETATSTLHFKVEEIDLYYYTAAPLSKIFNQDDQPRLTLITCQGDWVPTDQTDDHRLVVYATLVSS